MRTALVLVGLVIVLSGASVGLRCIARVDECQSDADCPPTPEFRCQRTCNRDTGVCETPKGAPEACWGN